MNASAVLTGAGAGSLRRLATSSAALTLLLIGGLVAFYHQTFGAMVDIWSRSDTFAHGFLIAPISLWLIWLQRHTLATMPSRPSWAGHALLAAAASAWLLGNLASVDVVMQFALVFMIVGVVLARHGWALTRQVSFPLGFLLFMVPFGEFLFAPMMDWTTGFLIHALRFTGVPVFAEGHTLVIPSGHWEVVEGCSGVRYLIASLVIGCLYAHLNYRSPLRKLGFIAASVIVPVLANWMRAWGIVMLGHFSDNRIATGVDHLVYGWVFFGVVIAALIWLGGRWQEPVRAGAPAERQPDAGQSAEWPSASEGVPAGGATLVQGPLQSVRLLLLAGVAVLGQAIPVVLDAAANHGAVNIALPAQFSEWQQVPQARLPDWTPHYQGMVSVDHRAYARSGEEAVGSYLAYYRDQKPGHEMISFENRVLVSKHPVWRGRGQGMANTQIGSMPVQVHTFEMAAGDERQMVWYAFWVNGRWTASPLRVKAWQALSRLMGRGDDAAVLMLHTRIDDAGRAAAVERLNHMAGRLGALLPQVLASAGGGQ